MKRTITIKGVGKASTKPDSIIIKLKLKSSEIEYDDSMALAIRKNNKLTQALVGIGIEKRWIKTSDFNIKTEYEDYRDLNDDWKSKFVGFACSQEINVAFDYDTKLLGRAINALALSKTDPEISIVFTVKDKDGMKNEMLQNAAENAMSQAKALCRATNTKLGSLLNIDYSWSEISFNSRTNYLMEASYEYEDALDIQAEDIDIRDTVTFIWELE